jgi:hypothetical protein
MAPQNLELRRRRWLDTKRDHRPESCGCKDGGVVRFCQPNLISLVVHRKIVRRPILDCEKNAWAIS